MVSAQTGRRCKKKSKKLQLFKNSIDFQEVTKVKRKSVRAKKLRSCTHALSDDTKKARQVSGQRKEVF
jgi:hypothetical protein